MRCGLLAGCLVLLAFSLGCAGKTAPGDGEKSADPPGEVKAIAVRAQPAELRKITETVEGLGRCEALPNGSAAVTAAVEGQVERLVVEVGQPVKRGDPMVQLDTRMARLASDKAQAVVDRLRPLAAKGEIAPPQLAEAEANAKQCALQLDLLTLRSPIDGILDSLACQVGQTLVAGSQIGSVVDAEQLQAVVWLPTRSAGRVEVGQKARIGARRGMGGHAGRSVSDDAEGVLGKVTFVGHVADSQTGNLPVHIKVENSGDRFAVGEVVWAAITVAEKKDVLVVPRAALFDVGDGPELNVIRDGISVRLRPRLGLRDARWVEIVGDGSESLLTAGEAVIVEGTYNLPEKTKVTVSGEGTKEEDSDHIAPNAGKDDKPGGAAAPDVAAAPKAASRWSLQGPKR
jgi:membrane fusion protein (multidrug efflux system)